MRILVTGGAGFIGSNFVTRSLVTRPNLEITVLDALTYAGNLRNLASVMDAIRFVHGDIRNQELVDALVQKSDLVIHFAAESHNDNSLSGPRLFFDTNVNGTLNVATSCAKNDVRLHHISTDEVFGDLPLDSDEEFDTDTPYNPSSPYSASKAASDHLVRAWIRSFGLQATISNCSNNYGPRQHWEKLIPATIKRLIEGEKPRVYGRGDNIRDWIHVDDHTDGIWSIIDRGPIGKTYLLGAKNQVSNLDLVKTVLKTMDAPEDFFEFIADRPGHDRKYAINPQSSRILGWRPVHEDVIESIPGLVETYRKAYNSEMAAP